MATVYKIDIELTSINVNYSPEIMAEIIKLLLEQGTVFENIEIKTKRIA